MTSYRSYGLLTGNCQECSLQSGVVRKNRFKAGILGILTGLKIIFKCKFANNVYLDSEANSLCETHGSQHAKCSGFAIYFSIGRVSTCISFSLFLKRHTLILFRYGWILCLLDIVIHYCYSLQILDLTL